MINLTFQFIHCAVFLFLKLELNVKAKTLCHDIVAWKSWNKQNCVFGSFHGARYLTNGVFIDTEATVGTYELRSYGGEQ